MRNKFIRVLISTVVLTGTFGYFVLNLINGYTLVWVSSKEIAAQSHKDNVPMLSKLKLLSFNNSIGNHSVVMATSPVVPIKHPVNEQSHGKCIVFSNFTECLFIVGWPTQKKRPIKEI